MFALTNNAVKVRNAQDIDIAALRVGVEQAGGAEVGSGLAASDAVAVAVHGGSGEGGGEEESGDGEELHFGGVWFVKREWLLA